MSVLILTSSMMVMIETMHVGFLIGKMGVGCTGVCSMGVL